MWSLEGGVLASALRASMPSSKSYSSQRRGGKKKKEKKCYSYSYNDPILTAMCCVHKIFYFFPEAKWPFVNTLVNVQWSKWIFKQVLYQIPAMMTLQGAVSALHQYIEWCVPRVGGEGKEKKTTTVSHLQIYSSRQALHRRNVLFLNGEQLWVLPPPHTQNVINSHFFSSNNSRTQLFSIYQDVQGTRTGWEVGIVCLNPPSPWLTAVRLLRKEKQRNPVVCPVAKLLRYYLDNHNFRTLSRVIVTFFFLSAIEKGIKLQWVLSTC